MLMLVMLSLRIISICVMLLLKCRCHYDYVVGVAGDVVYAVMRVDSVDVRIICVVFNMHGMSCCVVVVLSRFVSLVLMMCVGIIGSMVWCCLL